MEISPRAELRAGRLITLVIKLSVILYEKEGF
jgi:hypothetical protein